jgi:SAM-dependent methyltransferase
MNYSLENLVQEYKNMHSDPKKYIGEFLIPHADNIKELIDIYQVGSILDYGSGKGNQYTVDKIHETHFNNIMPTLYDIGVDGIDVLPNDTFDMVISTDVLEHIPEDLIPNALEEIYNRAKKCVYLAICNTENTKSKFSNGEGVHLTCKKGIWWINKIKPHAKVFTKINVYGKQGITEASFDHNGLTALPTHASTDSYRIKYGSQVEG